MIVFWVVAGVLSAVAAGLILQRAGRAASKPETADPTLEVFRRHLAELDDLAAQGLLPDSERRAAHAEAGRRLLGAADRPAADWDGPGSVRYSVLALAAGGPALAMVLYLATGSPGFADQPFGARLQAWRTAPPQALDPMEMTAVLRAITRERPEDPEALRFLALASAAADDPTGAVRALRQAVRLAPQRADLWESLGEAAMMQAGGEVTPQAVVAFRAALERDPTLAASRFHLARAQVAGGDRAAGVAAWRALLADLPEADPRRATVLAAIDDAQNAPEPDALPDQAAIRGMVEGLAARLAERPDDPEGWTRLVRAYGVLGDFARRDEALQSARARYAGRPDVLDALKAAAAVKPVSLETAQ